MASGSSGAVLRQFRTLFGAGTVAGMTDGQLLERFLGSRGEDAEVAFAGLVARHGPMVLGVCRRALADPNDADDAFQATFLILVRKARSVRVDDSLGRWLYGVSRRVAGRARACAARRRKLERAGDDLPEASSPEGDRDDLKAILDEEIARLAEPYRSAIVLCDLGGLTHEEAARDLRCPVGTVKSRLSRGRERLRGRLARRGLAPSGMAIGPALASRPTLPITLADATIRAAARFAESGALQAGMVPASAVVLAEGVLKAMTWSKLKLAAAAALSLTLTLGVAATGAGGPARPDEGGEKPPAAEARKSPDRASLEKGMADLQGELDRARRRLSEAQKAPGDAARARRRVQELEAAASRIESVLKSVLDRNEPAPKPVGLAGRGWPTYLSRGVQSSPPRELSKVSMPDYVVEPPDIIVVEALEALPGRPISGERLVRPDGKISLGFYGEVYVAGLTLAEIKAKIVLLLREFLTDEALGLAVPDRDHPGKSKRIEDQLRDSKRVFVDVAAYNSKVYYVQGEVNSPGRLAHTGNETVLDAINFAGGLTAKASKDRIRLVRPAPDKGVAEQTFLVDLAAIVEKGDTTANYQLLPGDRLIVDRDSKASPDQPAAKVPAEVDARLQAVEKKLDDVLKALERLPKP